MANVRRRQSFLDNWSYGWSSLLSLDRWFLNYTAAGIETKEPTIYVPFSSLSAGQMHRGMLQTHFLTNLAGTWGAGTSGEVVSGLI